MGCRGTAVVGAVPHGDGNRLVLDVAAVQRSAQVNRVGGAVLAADPDQLGHDCDRAVGASNNKVRNGSWPCEKALAEAMDASRSRRSGDARSFFRVWRLFRSGSAPEADSSRLGRFCNSRRTHVCDDYALITAMSGWTPKMFMTRVRL